MALRGGGETWRWALPRAVAIAGFCLVVWGVLEIGPRHAPHPGWVRGWIAGLVGMLAMVTGGPAAPTAARARVRAALAVTLVGLLSFVLLWLRASGPTGG